LCAPVPAFASLFFPGGGGKKGTTDIDFLPQKPGDP
jgi:hypothetical protein